MSEKKVTIKEIARNTGVSMGTVHRVIYGKGGVGEETRQRVLAEIERTNYQINTIAASMKRKAIVIAVVLPKPVGDERFYYRGIWKGVKESAEKLKTYKVEFRFIESEYGQSQIALELQKLFDNELDDINGIITLADDDETVLWLKRFQKQGVSVVTVSGYGEEHGCTCNIRVNHETAGQLAAEYMESLCGEKEGKYLILTGNQDIYSNRKYADGFVRAERKLGNEDKLLLLHGFGMNQIEEPCKKVLEDEQISGIFSCTARNTYSVCKILDEMNLKKIPVIGTDVFLELEEYFEKGILNASIYQYNVEQGRESVNILYRYLASSELEKENMIMPLGIVMKSNYQYYIS